MNFYACIPHCLVINLCRSSKQVLCNLAVRKFIKYYYGAQNEGLLLHFTVTLLKQAPFGSALYVPKRENLYLSQEQLKHCTY